MAAHPAVNKAANVSSAPARRPRQPITNSMVRKQYAAAAAAYLSDPMANGEQAHGLCGMWLESPVAQLDYLNSFDQHHDV
jgi:hypothetical protein